jgi:mono/diheme cytochrome c family protein
MNGRIGFATRTLLILLALVPVVLVRKWICYGGADAARAANPAEKTSATPQQPEGKTAFSREVPPLLLEYCVTCHGGTKPRGQLPLDQLAQKPDFAKNIVAWEKVLTVLRGGDMPPPGRKRPEPAVFQRAAAAIDAELERTYARLPRDPGRVTIRRLNRVEYRNTIRDLMGVDYPATEELPSDDVGYGFDNIADVLSLAPVHLEKYLAAAEKIVSEVFLDVKRRERFLSWRGDARNPREAARRILTEFARRAYRRPVSPQEVERLLQLVDKARQDGDGPEEALQVAFKAVLVSPHFLFRIERDPAPDEKRPLPLPAERYVPGVYPLSEYELATRLAYFLWSSMPDEELFQLADKGQLRQNLDAQVKRMLQSPKSRALVENFAGQWLQLRNLSSIMIDPKLFPRYDAFMRESMQRETEMYFEYILREDRSILEFLDSDYTFLNERLARHYGIEGVQGLEMRLVKLPDRRRGGILTHASILTVTSNPTRTSPVKRGKFILENILGTPPPPPPPDVPELDNDKNAVLTGSLRQRMEKHRENPGCAVCHVKMDALGFGLENFDAIGAWRTKDGSFEIDPSGTLPDGTTFRNPAELRQALLQQADQFRRCLAEKLLTYALGRGLEPTDNVFLREIVAQTKQGGDRFSALILAIVHSDPFQLRRGQRP